MTADEIRETNYGEVAYLREIAAQIAELNHRMECMLDVQTRGLKEWPPIQSRFTGGKCCSWSWALP